MPRAAWLPAVPVSAGAIIQDEQDRVLILKPTYKSGWTIPGGIMEDSGETPWEACRREVQEETGLVVDHGRLVCVDTRPARPDRQLGLRFLFHCGRLSDRRLSAIVVQQAEISEFRLARPAEALDLLRPAVRRRVGHGLAAQSCRYLQDGHPVAGVD